MGLLDSITTLVVLLDNQQTNEIWRFLMNEIQDFSKIICHVQWNKKESKEKHKGQKYSF